MCTVEKKKRIGAITASTLHMTPRYQGKDPDNYVVRIILGESEIVPQSMVTKVNQ